MTLKDLATQLNRPIGEVIKTLTRNGYKGIFKPTHTIPPEAVEVVIADINNAGLSLPSANPDTAPAPAPAPQPQPEAIQQAEPSTINNIAEAVKETQQKVSRDAIQQAVNDFAELGTITAISANMSFKKAYSETLEALAVMDSMAQQALVTEIQKEFMENQLAFFGESTAKTYHQSQSRTVRDTAQNTRDLMKKLSW